MAGLGIFLVAALAAGFGLIMRYSYDKEQRLQQRGRSRPN